jgi:hypothetical protein
MMYNPDNWVVIKINGDDPHYRVLGGWSGGYTTGDSWRMNSGITSATEDDVNFNFYGTSGSCYTCKKESYTLRMNNAGVWDNMKKQFGNKVELMDENTKWLSIDWIIK